MTEQIRFFNMAYSDFTNPNLSFEVTDSVATNTGEEIATNLANRSLTTGWMTTGSTDAAGTELICRLGDVQPITDIFLVQMNFKDYTLDYWSGAAWVNIATVTSNTKETVGHEVSTSSSAIRLTITATMVADDQKQMRQLIVAKELGQFEDWPVISGTEHSLGKQVNKVLSGKAVIDETVGAFRCSLKVNGWTNQNDIDLLELIIFAREGVLMYINAGSTTNFKFELFGYRANDFYVVRPENEYSNDLYKGIYTANPKIKIDFVEVAGK